ncbi:MAG: Glycosyltransferase group 2 family protein [Candidatus Collierbacteria bacterium GW2011_GWB1_44_6]|uniref:Glycosyltransferase group 2 family protein n=2 Tax=Candidatus Collieribacteriota TaxID=1752725 RepID=A0A0G1MP30_9BACT|nr:MAG: Glycosyltransferase group 2 family protein [Candidatus Collierbacteria bacterium GW2011_GWC2_43_12]KKT73774.1 MAG: Glycosyltransferase group 2 family protein [Candidatus Collierbacteria bacterium GW2011_GWB1_44_6]KKT83752.1 MAG: Glycosyltransferase group 2 family protein [Microgenomates group bacterium GW2011_GWC1_44_9]
MKTKNPLFSVVIPVYNEEGNVLPLFKEIKKVMTRLGSFEIIFVNDGSTDNTGVELKRLRKVKIVQFRKNFGQSAALDAGVKAAKGKYVVTLDGDGQNDPADIPKLFGKLNQGYDVVCGWRYNRKDNWIRKFISEGARRLRSVLVDDKVHDAGCTLRVYNKVCFTDLDLAGEMHRMIPAILRWRGFRITELKVNHRPRIIGKSKYGMSRTIKGFLDMLLIWFTRKYNNRPLHLFGTVGLSLIFASVLLLSALAILKTFYGYSLSDKIWPLVGMISFLAGIQLLVSGILADLTIKNNTVSKEWMIKTVRGPKKISTK